MKQRSYTNNVCSWLKRRGLAPKYDHAGIYCIKVDEMIVYVGKSVNMLRRVAEHYVAIQQQREKKYRILAEAHRKGHSINFDVLYYATSETPDEIEEEIGRAESQYINQYAPLLNTQIPQTDNWKIYTA